MRYIHALTLLCLLPHIAEGQVVASDSTHVRLKGMPVAFWVEQLADTSRAKALQARRALGDAGPDAAGAVPALIDLLDHPTDRVKINAAIALGNIGGPASDAVEALLAYFDHPNDELRETVAESLGAIGPAARSAVPALAERLSDPSSDVRIEAAWALGEIGGAHAVEALIPALRDPHPDVQAWAVRSLAKLGGAAAAAVPALASLVQDAEQPLSGDAAWALGRVLPRARPHTISMSVQVEGEAAALRDDGRGAYMTAVDSVWALSCEALNLWLQWSQRRPCVDPSYRLPTMVTRSSPAPRRLLFDLTRPVPGSGARSLGLVRAETAEIHIFWRHEHEQRIDGIQLVPVSDTAVASERAQFHFVLDGEPYRLQMGEWAAGEFQRNVPKIHGETTSHARMFRPSHREWIVEAPAGSHARLWNLKDPAAPVDLGLYEFPFRIRWEALGTR